MHRVVAADRHVVPAPFRAWAVRSEEACHAYQARVPYGRVHVMPVHPHDAPMQAWLRAGYGRVQIAQAGDVDYAATTWAELAAIAPQAGDLTTAIADALQHTGVLGSDAAAYRAALQHGRVDFLASRGAGFHNDVARHWSRCLFWLLALDVADVEFVMPHVMGMRQPLAAGDLLLFDQTMAHGLCRPRDAGQFVLASFETGHHDRQLFLTGELLLDDAQWQALGAAWLPVEDHQQRGALDLLVASFDERSGAVQRLSAMHRCMHGDVCHGLEQEGALQGQSTPPQPEKRT